MINMIIIKIMITMMMMMMIKIGSLRVPIVGLLHTVLDRRVAGSKGGASQASQHHGDDDDADDDYDNHDDDDGCDDDREDDDDDHDDDHDDCNDDRDDDCDSDIDLWLCAFCTQLASSSSKVRYHVLTWIFAIGRGICSSRSSDTVVNFKMGVCNSFYGSTSVAVIHR